MFSVVVNEYRAVLSLNLVCLSCRATAAPLVRTAGTSLPDLLAILPNASAYHRVCSSYSGRRLCIVFALARRDFFSPRPHLQPLLRRSFRSPMLVLFDFDETLTSHDTLSLIPGPPGPSGGGEQPRSFNDYAQLYMQDQEEHARSHPQLSVDANRTTRSAQFEWLASLGAVEKKSVDRVERGGLFQGWQPHEAERRARDKVQARQGVEELGRWLCSMKQTEEGNAAEATRHFGTGVISVSWSRTFIAACLEHHAAGWKPDFIRANEVQTDEQGKGTGKLSKLADRGIRTGLDKLREMGEALEMQDRSAGQRNDLVVYAGDSNTDLPCLLAASVGFVVVPPYSSSSTSHPSSLEKTIQRLGLSHRVARDGQEMEQWLQDGQRPRRIRQADMTREAVETKADSDVWLVRVEDWQQGTKTLERLSRWDREVAASND